MQMIVPRSILRSVGSMPNKQGAQIPKDSLHRRNRDGLEDGACVKPGNPAFLPLPSKEKQDVDF